MTDDETPDSHPAATLSAPARRVEGFRLLGQAVSQTEVARLLGVSRQAVHAWARLLAESRQRGVSPVTRPRGRPQRLSEVQRQWLTDKLAGSAEQAGLSAGPWTVDRVRGLLACELSVQFSHGGCWELMRQLGWRSGRQPRTLLDQDLPADALQAAQMLAQAAADALPAWLPPPSAEAASADESDLGWLLPPPLLHRQVA